MGLAIALLPGTGVASDADGALKEFLVVYRPGPGWLPGKPLAAQPLKEHGRYMLQLYVDGRMKFAGPFLDDAGGAVVLAVTDAAQAAAIVAADPAVASGVFISELHPWHRVDWEQRAANQPAR